MPKSTTTPTFGYVYFVHLCPDGPLKIGVTKDIQKRFYDLQQASPFRLQPMVLLRLENFLEASGVEQLLHQFFADINIRGEWFYFHPGLCAMVKWLRAGNHDQVRVMGQDVPIVQTTSPLILRDVIEFLERWVEKNGQSGIVDGEHEILRKMTERLAAKLGVYSAGRLTP